MKTETATKPGVDGFGQRLRRIRHEYGLTQQTLEYEAGLSQAVVSKIESGGKLPSVRKMVRLAEYLEVTPDELLGMGEWADQ